METIRYRFHSRNRADLLAKKSRSTLSCPICRYVNQRVALLLKRQKGICPFCRLFFKDRDLLEIDHIIPRSQGGLDEFKNL